MRERIIVSKLKKSMMECTFPNIKLLIQVSLGSNIANLLMSSLLIYQKSYCFLNIGYSMMEILTKCVLKQQRMCYWPMVYLSMNTKNTNRKWMLSKITCNYADSKFKNYNTILNTMSLILIYKDLIWLKWKKKHYYNRQLNHNLMLMVIT